MEQLLATSNIANKVRNTRLPRTKPLLPLFETVSNSLHAIIEAEKVKLLKKGDGEIIIECIRNGDKDTLASLPDIDTYPINSFIISDNGIGLTDENLKAFMEADTDHKITIGGKGIGRFICLKAFREMNIQSQYVNKNETIESVKFDFKATKKDFTILLT